MKNTCLVCPQLFWILSIPAFIVLYLLTAATVLLLLPLAYLNLGRAVRTGVNLWAHLAFLIMFKRLRINGKHYLTKDQRYILLANHSSLFDILAIMAFYPGVSWFGREYLVKIPIFGRLLRMINYVPMKAADLRNTREMIARLTENTKNHTVAIFPEGTRTIDGSINRFRKGFLHVMKASELSIVPVTLNGFYRFKPKNRFAINFAARLGVVVHQPISHSELLNKNDREIIDHVKEIIESAYDHRKII